MLTLYVIVASSVTALAISLLHIRVLEIVSWCRTATAKQKAVS